MQEIKKTIDDLTTEIIREIKIMEDKISQCNTNIERCVYQELVKQLQETYKNLKTIWTICELARAITKAMPPLSPPIKGQ